MIGVIEVIIRKIYNMTQITLGDLIGSEMEEEFMNFNFTEIQEILQVLQQTEILDIAHAELLQQRSLRGADLISEYLGKVVKTVSYLESQVSTAKNRASLNYQAPDGAKTTADMKKWFGESAPEVEAVQMRLAKAKASKVILEKKYDILIRSHHHAKDIASGLRRSVLGYNNTGSNNAEKVPEGWE